MRHHGLRPFRYGLVCTVAFHYVDRRCVQWGARRHQAWRVDSLGPLNSRNLARTKDKRGILRSLDGGKDPGLVIVEQAMFLVMETNEGISGARVTQRSTYVRESTSVRTMLRI